MSARFLMVMGTQSNVGKSVLVTALCRLFAREGLRVAPFKAQNISLNAGVTPDGREIGRSTLAQAEAARAVPHADMNPVLLKPEGEGRSQIVLNGRPWGRLEAASWRELKPRLRAETLAAFDRLRERYDLLVIEGAGSPAELNLKAEDLVNFGIARHAGAPVLLVGDIEHGGVFASLVGTLALLEPEERALVRGLVINKFRGDPALLGDGLQQLAERAGVPVLGLIPHLAAIGLAPEDGLALEPVRGALGNEADGTDVAVIRLPHLSNFDDFDPLAAEPGVRVRFVDRLDDLGDPDAVLLPGSKATLADLEWLRAAGLADRIRELAERGKPVAGLCGGYQMLGLSLADPDGVEAAPGAHADGLGLLPLETVFAGDKRTERVEAVLEAGAGPFAGLRGDTVHGYEIHLGRSRVTGGAPPVPLCRIGGDPDGAVHPEGKVWGTYLHGLFDNDRLRHAWLRSLGWTGEGRTFDREPFYDRLADHVKAHLDWETVRGLVGASSGPNPRRPINSSDRTADTG